MGIFKKGDTPLKTIVTERECKRHYRYIHSSSPYVNLGGYECKKEQGFGLVHHLDQKRLAIKEINTGEFSSFSCGGPVYVENMETLEALVEALQDVLSKWEGQ